MLPSTEVKPPEVVNRCAECKCEIPPDKSLCDTCADVWADLELAGSLE